MPTLILYACPTGPLAAQIETYFEKSRTLIGPNTAHDYMPHCTLTGFFQDEAAAIPGYVQALNQALKHYVVTRPQPVIQIKGVAFESDWHGLLLESPWLKALVKSFATLAQSSTRQENLRLKDWLHLSLAYDFPPDQHQFLQQLAEQLIFINAAVNWQLQFYERLPGNQWICHQTWSLFG